MDRYRNRKLLTAIALGLIPPVLAAISLLSPKTNPTVDINSNLPRDSSALTQPTMERTQPAPLVAMPIQTP